MVERKVESIDDVWASWKATETAGADGFTVSGEAP